MFARDPTDSTRLGSTRRTIVSVDIFVWMYLHAFQLFIPVFTRQIQNDFNVNLHNFPRQTVQENIELPKYFDTEFRVEDNK